MILTEEEKITLVQSGYVKMPHLKLGSKKLNSFNELEFPEKNYTENSIYNKTFQALIDMDSLKKELADIGLKHLGIRVNRNDIYQVTRYLKPNDYAESYRGHFDSHLFTLVTPIRMPKASGAENGQLIVFPKLRAEPKNELANIAVKALYKLKYGNEKGLKKLMKDNKNFIEFDFLDMEPVLFLGRQSFHANRGFEKSRNGDRLTLLTHFFDPTQNGIGALLRKWRDR